MHPSYLVTTTQYPISEVVTSVQLVSSFFPIPFMCMQQQRFHTFDTSRAQAFDLILLFPISFRFIYHTRAWQDPSNQGKIVLVTRVYKDSLTFRQPHPNSRAFAFPTLQQHPNLTPLIHHMTHATPPTHAGVLWHTPMSPSYQSYPQTL